MSEFLHSKNEVANLSTDKGAKDVEAILYEIAYDIRYGEFLSQGVFSINEFLEARSYAGILKPKCLQSVVQTLANHS